MGNCSPNLLDSYHNHQHQHQHNSPCISSANNGSSHLTRHHFDVYNVDARLFKHSKGQIQITSNQMIYQKSDIDANDPESNNSQSNTSPIDASQHQIVWPLNGLRRYGHYKDIFLFESGRKCATGEGLFAFKCAKAKRLSNELHKAIMQNASSLCNLQRNPSKTRANPHQTDTLSQTPLAVTRTSSESSHPPDGGPSESPNLNTSMIYSTDTQSDTQANKSPYYVNDLKSIVRLPPSLSFINSDEARTTSAATARHG